jgi:hypothetical protein
MARKPAAPPPSGGAESGDCERFGPLAIARVGKDDGRALIIYSHAERETHEDGETHDERETHEERERT